MQYFSQEIGLQLVLFVSALDQGDFHSGLKHWVKMNRCFSIIQQWVEVRRTSRSSLGASNLLATFVDMTTIELLLYDLQLTMLVFSKRRVGKGRGVSSCFRVSTVVEFVVCS